MFAGFLTRRGIRPPRRGIWLLAGWCAASAGAASPREAAEMATVASLQSSGVTVRTAVDPKDDTLTDATITVAPGAAPAVDSIGYALFVQPIDRSFCLRADHAGVPVLEQKTTRAATLAFSFRTAAARNGYIVARRRGPEAGAWILDYIKLESLLSPP